MYLFILVLLTTVGVSKSRPTFIDSIPIVSQAKFLFLYAIGEKAQAQESWNNFKNITHLWENVKHIDESIPVVGHIEAAIFELNGDTERAKEIFASANKGSFILGGIILCGPAGAVAGSLTGDTFNSVVLQKPMGIIDNVVHFKEIPASQHVDAVLELTLAAAMAKGVRTGKNMDPIHTTVNLEMKLADTKNGVTKRVRFDENLNTIHEIPEAPLGIRRTSFEETPIRRQQYQRRTETIDEQTPLLSRLEREYESLPQVERSKMSFTDYFISFVNKINEVNQKIMDAQMG
ncbi:uncharacterized protein LOC122849372 [Aphidius gifuensis]|uniref:uncharacterized protein LOC122849372 n=1 Tax=Aphidius gifuensis TaxID=684658 RepID=UPI001CDD321F|nr:uncharacterized protein LOC122849372 [Aphidius gifuensis]